jgi:hypothetical protein
MNSETELDIKVYCDGGSGIAYESNLTVTPGGGFRNIENQDNRAIKVDDSTITLNGRCYSSGTDMFIFPNYLNPMSMCTTVLKLGEMTYTYKLIPRTINSNSL